MLACNMLLLKRKPQLQTPHGQLRHSRSPFCPKAATSNSYYIILQAKKVSQHVIHSRITPKRKEQHKNISQKKKKELYSKGQPHDKNHGQWCKKPQAFHSLQLPYYATWNVLLHDATVTYCSGVMHVIKITSTTRKHTLLKLKCCQVRSFFPLLIAHTNMLHICFDITRFWSE